MKHPSKNLRQLCDFKCNLEKYCISFNRPFFSCIHKFVKGLFMYIMEGKKSAFKRKFDSFVMYFCPMGPSVGL